MNARTAFSCLIHKADRILPIGPRSVLFGSRQFLLHPLFVAAAWRRLYGFPLDPRLWVAFFVHDLGYLLRWCRNLDGTEGERQSYSGAAIMNRLFDRRQESMVYPHTLLADRSDISQAVCEAGWKLDWKLSSGAALVKRRKQHWRNFTLYRSRGLAARDGQTLSRLGVADELAATMMPWWVRLPLATLSGEEHEYRRNGHATVEQQRA